MRIIDAIPLIDAHLDANDPIMLEGPTGVGKSDVIRQLAAKRGWYLIDKFRASTLDPVDLRGVPSIVNGRTVFNPPDDFPDETRDGPDGIMFLDEIDTGTMSVQAAMFQLTLDRCIGGAKLPSGCRIVAARNGSTFSRASQRLSQPLCSRFGHITIDPDMESWALWAADNGILPEIVAFLRWSESRSNPLLCKMPDGHDDGPFPTARGWERVSRISEKAPAMMFQTAAANVGMPAAVEFKGFLDVYRDLPKLEDIVADPTAARVPIEPTQQFAVSAMLARAATAQNLKAVVAYLKRLPVEFSVMAVTDAIRRDADLKQAPGFTDWATSSQAVVL